MSHQRIWLEKGQGLGISIAVEGSSEDTIILNKRPIFISRVRKGGAAEQDGRLGVGDIILKVNGKSLIGMTYDQAIELFRQAGEVVELEVAKLDPTLSEKKNKKRTHLEEQYAHDLEDPPAPTTTLGTVTNAPVVPDADPVPKEPNYEADSSDVILQLILFFGMILIYRARNNGLYVVGRILHAI